MNLYHCLLLEQPCYRSHAKFSTPSISRYSVLESRKVNIISLTNNLWNYIKCVRHKRYFIGFIFQISFNTIWFYWNSLYIISDVASWLISWEWKGRWWAGVLALTRRLWAGSLDGIKFNKTDSELTELNKPWVNWKSETTPEQTLS